MTLIQQYEKQITKKVLVNDNLVPVTDVSMYIDDYDNNKYADGYNNYSNA